MGSESRHTGPESSQLEEEPEKHYCDVHLYFDLADIPIAPEDQKERGVIASICASADHLDGRTLIEVLRSRKQYLTVKEFSGMISMGERTIYNAVQQGRIPSIKVLGSVRLDPKQMAVWLEDRQIAA